MIAADESMIMNPNLLLNNPILLRNLGLVARSKVLTERYGTTNFECDYIKICKEPYGSVVFERYRGWFGCMTFKTDGVRTVVEHERFGKKVILYQTDEAISFQSE
jgi:hypothetical protein